MLNELIYRALISANIPATREPRGMMRSDDKRPDGVTMVPWAGGKCLVWDATVPDTLAPSHFHATAIRAGAAAEKAASAKTTKYSSILSSHHFIPVAIETFGAYCLQARQFVSDLGRRLAVASGNPREVTFLRQRLSIAVQRGNTIAVLGTLRESGGILFNT